METWDALAKLFAVLCAELRQWRAQHPEATLDEIAAQLTPRHQQLMGQLLVALALQPGDGYALEGYACPACGAPMVYKGHPARQVDHLEGVGELPRAYYHCPGCGPGFSPLDERLGLGPHRWTPATLSTALRLAVDVPSVRRAAEHFEALTHLPLSKSSLHALLGEVGTRLVQQEEAEAEALSAGVETPPPAPDAETMAVSLDGVMVHLREGGWKEAKVAAFSAVRAEAGAEGAEPTVHLERHSYRAGLWEAPAFAQQQWAEGRRRGLEQAARVVAVSDGAPWIWNIVRSCYAPCVEILDWWHALRKLWVIAGVVYGEGTAEAAAWVATLKAQLWAGEVRALFEELRQHRPRGQALPEALRLALGYLWHHRQRMRYARFRAAGQPVGSGTVESACKVVVQERACQAGMRWSRPRLQALLALRCALLSDRWDTTWAGLTAAKISGHTPGTLCSCSRCFVRI